MVVILAINWLLTLVDAYDLFVPGFIAPELIKSWHIAPASLGPMFSAGLLGIVIGAPTFGWIGDRYGRKKSAIIGSVLYGLLSLASMETTTIGQLSWLRLFTGIALGGVIANSIALVAEFAPKRVRATMVLAVSTAAAFGLLIPGGGRDAGRRFIENLRMFYHVANIGEVRSLAIHPASTTHSQLTPREQAQTGVTDGYVRLSIGIEHIDDIIADLDQALAAA